MGGKRDEGKAREEGRKGKGSGIIINGFFTFTLQFLFFFQVRMSQQNKAMNARQTTCDPQLCPASDVKTRPSRQHRLQRDNTEQIRKCYTITPARFKQQVKALSWGYDERTGGRKGGWWELR